MTHSFLEKEVTVEIKGGLGNQMFQYAAARSFSLEIGAKLFVEKNLGFKIDRHYKRNFELDKLPTVYVVSKFCNSFPFYLDRIKSFYIKRFRDRQVKEKFVSRIFERNFRFIDLVKVDRTRKRYWMSGYFQDPRYFQSHKERVLFELTPPMPSDRKYVELAKLSEKFELVAVGIRIYEESASPEVHARDGMRKSIEDYQYVLENLAEKVSNPLILVFTTRQFSFLESMGFPANTIFVNSDTNFHGATDKLWLLSKCQHHVFNNSTFYWWGATLSEANFKGINQQIFCADNFLNPDISYPHWESF
jgi:hypothetical protein